jgi:hypothetical protein
MKKYILNVNTRTCPTTFILIPTPPSPSQQPDSHESNSKQFFHHLHSLFHAFKSPKQTFLSFLKDKYYLILLCDLCHSSHENISFWYELNQPKEIVQKILPLARVGLTFITTINQISSLGRIFGLPFPKFDEMFLETSIEFLDSLESNGLDDYDELQKYVEERSDDHVLQQETQTQTQTQTQTKTKLTAEEVAAEGGATTTGTATATRRVTAMSMGETGYCLREFERFLNEHDPNKVWSQLSPRVTENGDLCFVCSSCLQKSK